MPLAHHNHVLVWEDPSDSGYSWASIYACSPRHPTPVPVMTVFNPVCPSPTGCTDWTVWDYSQADVAGPWVVASGAFPGSEDGIGLWNSRARQPPRNVATLPGGPAGIYPYALVLRSDGALAFAYQNINNNGRYLDVLDACGAGCRHLRRLDMVLYPADSTGERQLLTDVHFGDDKRLFWRDAGQLRQTRLD